MSIRVLRGVAVVAAALSLAVISYPAEADTRAFADAAGDSGGSADITTVKVANGSGGGHRIAVRADVGDLRSYDVFNIWLDTDRADPGPEYRIRFIADDDPPDVSRVERFSDAGDTVPCPESRFEADPLVPMRWAVRAAQVRWQARCDPGRGAGHLRGPRGQLRRLRPGRARVLRQGQALKTRIVVDLSGAGNSGGPGRGSIAYAGGPPA